LGFSKCTKIQSKTNIHRMNGEGSEELCSTAASAAVLQRYRLGAAKQRRCILSLFASEP